MLESQFDYCPLIWMLCSKTDMQRVEEVQFKTLQVVYNCTARLCALSFE